MQINNSSGNIDKLSVLWGKVLRWWHCDIWEFNEKEGSIRG